jgi:hypothetical protein
MVTTLPLRPRVRARTREGTSSASPVDRHAHAAKHRIPDSEFIIKDHIWTNIGTAIGSSELGLK